MLKCTRAFIYIVPGHYYFLVGRLRWQHASTGASGPGKPNDHPEQSPKRSEKHGPPVLGGPAKHGPPNTTSALHTKERPWLHCQHQGVVSLILGTWRLGLTGVVLEDYLNIQMAMTMRTLKCKHIQIRGTSCKEITCSMFLWSLYFVLCKLKKA